jgi:hypothetical protein
MLSILPRLGFPSGLFPLGFPTRFAKYHMKIFLGDFNAKVSTEGIFRPTIGKESLHEISNDNGVTVVNLATSKNRITKSTMFPHCNIHKYIWSSPDGKNPQSD